MEEMIRRGTKEIAEHECVPWRDEVVPLAQHSNEVRFRLALVLRTLDIEQAKVCWRGMKIPEVAAYADQDAVPAIEYGSAIGAAIGSGIDIECLKVERGWGKNYPNPLLHRTRADELFWEYVARNAGSVSVWDEDGYIRIDSKPEDKLLAFDGAFCGKLALDGKGIGIFFLTDPSVRFYGWRIDTLEVTVGGKRLPLHLDMGACTDSHAYAPFPDGFDASRITDVEVHVTVAGAPVLRATIDDLSALQERVMDGVRVRVYPPVATESIVGSQYMTRCDVLRPRTATEEAISNFPKRFFTLYRSDSDGPAITYPGEVHYERMPDGAQFHLLTLLKPIRVDVRVPQVSVLHTMPRTLHYVIKQHGGE